MKEVIIFTALLLLTLGIKVVGIHIMCTAGMDTLMYGANWEQSAWFALGTLIAFNFKVERHK